MKSLLAAVVITHAGYALAEQKIELPDVGLVDKCRAKSEAIGGSKSGAVNDECVSTERAAYENLKQYWPKLDEGQKSKCVAASKNQKVGTYKILQQCLSQEEMKVDGKVRTDLKKPSR